MFVRTLIVPILCTLVFVAPALAQPSPEHEKMRNDARAAYDRGSFEEAKDLTTKILALNPKDHAALYLRASSRVELGVMKHDFKEIRDGIEDARESLKVAGGGEVNYYLPYLFGMVSLANLEQKKEHANVAVEIAKKVLSSPSLTPQQRSDILYQRAAAFMATGNLESAIEDYQAATKSNPEHLGSYMGLAQCYTISGQPEKALATFNAAVEAFPKHHLVYNNRGLYLQQQGKLQESIADFNKAIELAPDGQFSVAYANRGFSNQGLGNLPAAEADFTKALSLEPQNGLFTSLRGTCRLAAGNVAGAIEDYTQAIRLNPQNPVPHADLGFAKYFSKDYAGAVAAYDQALQIDPNAMRYLNPWKLWSLVLSGRPDAIGEITAASEKAGKDGDWIDQQVLFLKGDISEKQFMDFVEKTPDPKLKNAQKCEALYFIGERRLQANDKDNAVKFYQNVVALKEPQLSAYRGAQFALKSLNK